jgi:hypothetical protein
MRVWIDGVLLIDEWRNQLATFTASRALTAGAQDVRIEYFETNQGAVAKFNWTAATAPPPTSCPSGQYRAEYFANKTLSGTAVSTACETAPLNRNWGNGGPTGAGPNNFLARWTGSVAFVGGTTTFTAASDDGMRVWLDGCPDRRPVERSGHDHGDPQRRGRRPHREGGVLREDRDCLRTTQLDAVTACDLSRERLRRA